MRVVISPPRSAPATVAIVASVIDTSPTSASVSPASIQKGLSIGVIAASPSLNSTVNANSTIAPGASTQARSSATQDAVVVPDRGAGGACVATTPSTAMSAASARNRADQGTRS